MSPTRPARWLLALLLLLPMAALAQSAFTTQAVNMRAGPDRAFPLVTWLRPGTPVNVIGCTSGWRWCDVVASGWRGWVYARYLSGPMRSRAPVITFSVGPYWGAHYRGRSWYSSRSQWNNWGSPGFRPPPPPPPRHRPPPSRPPGARPPSRPPQGPPSMGPPPAGQRPGQGGNRPPGARPPSGESSNPGGNRPGGGRPPSGDGSRPSRSAP